LSEQLRLCATHAERVNALSLPLVLLLPLLATWLLYAQWVVAA
jgi:hypothetical protein